MIHVVRRGDTLGDLAVRYQTSVAALQFLNQIPNSELLVPGQALLIPSPERTGPFSIQVNGYAYPFISRWVLERTLPCLSALSVFTYGFTAEGDLRPPLLRDDWMTELAAEASVTPVMVLAPMTAEETFSNVLLTAVLSSRQAQRRLLSQTARTMEEKGFRELNIDFEYVPAANRDDLTEFVRLAKRMLPWPVSVCLAPKTYAGQRGLLYEGKDYAALGAAADRLLLMTYEWGYKYGPPMAIAPLNQVRRVVEYAVTEIPAEKLSLGLPNYGYDWPLPWEQGRTIARTIGSMEAVSIARQTGAEIRFDPTARSPWFSYGKGGKDHVVWFEDVRSWQAKFELLQEFGLGGLGIWTVMNLNRPGLVLISQRF